MTNEWKIPIKNYLKKFENQRLFVSGCKRIIHSHFEKLRRVPKSTKYSYLGGAPVPLDLILRICNGEELEEAYNKIKFFASRSNKGVKLPKVITPELSYVVGVLRDGSISKLRNRNGTQYVLAISQSGKGANGLIRFLARIFRKIFKAKVKIDKNSDEVRLRILSKPVVLFFEKVFEMSQDQAYWETPKLIKQNPKSWFYYIAGFFDAEGYCPSVSTLGKTKRYKLKITQVNSETLNFIKRVLESNFIKVAGPYKNANRATSDIFIYGYGGCKRFHNLVPLVRKHKNLELLLDPPKRVPFEMSLRTASLETDTVVEH